MRVVVKLFAGLRERAGEGTREVDVAERTRACDVWGAIGFSDEPDGILYAINKRYVEPDTELAEGDELALIPPVSGGAFRLTKDPIDLDRVVADVRRAEAGAIATFSGTTRIHSRGRTVVHLEYEAYPGMAEKVMEEIASRLEEKYELCAVAITHRVGRVGIGDTSVAIAVSAPHRHDALAACRDAIDELKERVPLWKKEVYEGGEEWIGRGS